MSDYSGEAPVTDTAALSEDHGMGTGSNPADAAGVHNTPKDSSGGDTQVMASLPATVSLAVRDESFYFQDGSCVLLVENCLFRIHHSILEMHSTFFKTMFSLPQSQEDLTIEGSCDSNPIVCHEDAADFRALCWALYASPTSIMEQTMFDKVKVPRLIQVIAMAQKYEFIPLRDWAFDTIDAHWLVNPPHVLSVCKTWENVKRLLLLCCLSNRAEMQLRIENAWLQQILASQHRQNAFQLALDVAEGNNLRRFHGRVYYTYLKAIGKFKKRPATSPASQAAMEIGSIASYVDKEPLPDLCEARRLQLYQGFWSLVQLRHQLDAPPQLHENNQCPEHGLCMQGWGIWWKKALEAIEKEGRLNDPNDLFQELQKRILVYGIFLFDQSREVPCAPLIKKQVCSMRQQLDDTLADHFMIPQE